MNGMYVHRLYFLRRLAIMLLRWIRADILPLMLLARQVKMTSTITRVLRRELMVVTRFRDSLLATYRGTSLSSAMGLLPNRVTEITLAPISLDNSQASIISLVRPLKLN